MNPAETNIMGMLHSQAFLARSKELSVDRSQIQFPSIDITASIRFSLLIMRQLHVAGDLYLDVVKSKTEWPTNDYSIKTLATYLGFKWRDKEPYGAASIEWYHRLVETGESGIRQRILDYNEDDCIAMRVLLEGIQKLSLRC